MELQGTFLFLMIVLSSGVSGRGGYIGGIETLSVMHFQPIRGIKAVKVEMTCLYEEVKPEGILNRMSRKKIVKMFRRIAKRDGKKSKFDGKIRLLKKPVIS